MTYIDVVPVVQDIPILTNEDLEPLREIIITTIRGKRPNTRTTTQDLYTANDTEFMKWLAYVTKTKQSRLMATVEDGLIENGGWTNANRLRRRLDFLKRYRKSVDRYLKALDTE